MAGTAFSSANWEGYDEQSVTNPGSALTDFTLLIDISTLSSDWKAEVQSDAGDIRVTKGDNTELPLDVIDFAYNAGAPTGHIRAKYSGTLAASGTQNVRVWAGYTPGTAVAYDATETYGSDNAYDSNWLQYLPLDGDANDRTSNANNGSLTSLAFPTDEITGQVGSGLDLDGSNDSITAGTGLLDGLTAVTVMAWVNAASQSTATEDTILSNWDSVATNANILWRYNSNTNIMDTFMVGSGQSSVSASNAVTIEGGWHHMAFGWDNSAGTGTQYTDGSAESTTLSETAQLESSTQGELWGATPHTGADYWLGGLDELQIHTTNRGSAWVDLEHAQSNSQSTFWGTWAWTASGGGVTVNAPAGSISIAGQVPTISTGVQVDSPANSLTISGQVPTVATGVIVDAPAGSISLAAFAPGIGSGTQIDVPAAVLSVSGLVPTVSTGVLVAVPLNQLTISGQVPTVTAADNINISVPLGTITLTGHLPTVTASDGFTAEVPAASISLTNYAPEIFADFILRKDTKYEVFIQRAPGRWEHTLIEFTGSSIT